jgi:hypothetical protein
MLKMRLGAVPDIEVKMPHPFAHVEQPVAPVPVYHSCHSAKIVKSYGQLLGGAGRQLSVLSAGSLLHTKSSRPLEVTFTALKVWSYNVNGKGSGISVSRQAQ